MNILIKPSKSFRKRKQAYLVLEGPNHEDELTSELYSSYSAARVAARRWAERLPGSTIRDLTVTP